MASRHTLRPILIDFIIYAPARGIGLLDRRTESLQSQYKRSPVGVYAGGLARYSILVYLSERRHPPRL